MLLFVILLALVSLWKFYIVERRKTVLGAIIFFNHKMENKVSEHDMDINGVCCRGKPNLLDMGSLMIKPIQRVMKYPLLLCELRNSTPPSHPDYRALEEAFAAVKDINVNINELKRRKDLGRWKCGRLTVPQDWSVLFVCDITVSEWLHSGRSERDDLKSRVRGQEQSMRLP